MGGGGGKNAGGTGMAKAVLKTTATELSVADYIAALPDARRREEAAAIDALFRRVTGLEPRMWGPSIIGYGSYDYKYDSGREGTTCRAGFSPRKAALTFYGFGDVAGSDAGAALLGALGKHSLGQVSLGKGCLYLKKLAGLDIAVLEQLVAMKWELANAPHPA